MSMSLYVILSLQSAPDLTQWEGALRRLTVPVHIAENVNLREYSGFLPMSVNGEASGLYFLKETYQPFPPFLPTTDGLGIEQPIVYSLGYGGDPMECAAVFYSATALVKEFGGRAFDIESGRFLGPKQLTDSGNRCYEMAQNSAD